MVSIKQNVLVANLLATIKERGFSIPKFAKEAGIPKDRIYKWKLDGTNPKVEDVKIIERWINGKGVDEAPRGTKPKAVDEKEGSGIEGKSELKYIQLLEQNDRFFKESFTGLMANLGAILKQTKYNEELIKLNLQHTGTIEAIEKGVQPDAVHEQINNEIADVSLSEKDKVERR